MNIISKYDYSLDIILKRRVVPKSGKSIDFVKSWSWSRDLFLRSQYDKYII